MGLIKPGTPAFTRSLGALFAGGFVTLSILYSPQPLLPIFSEQFQVTPAVASLSLSLSTGALAVCMLFASALSDQWGRKKLMVLSLMLSSALAILVPFSPHFPLLLTIRALLGIVLSGLPSIAMTYVSEEFHPNHLGQVMGIYIAGTSIGGMAARVVVGILTDLFSWKAALAIMGTLSFALSWWFWVSLPEPQNFRPTRRIVRQLIPSLFQCLKDPGLLSLYGISFLLMGSFVSLYNYVEYQLAAPPYRLSPFAASWIFLTYLTGTFSSAWMGCLADRLGQAKVLWIGITFMLLGARFSLLADLALKILSISLFTFGFFGSHSVASGWVGKRATALKAQASSLYLFFYYTGSSLLGTCGGWVWSRFRWPGVVAMISILLLTAFLLPILVSALKPKALSHSPDPCQQAWSNLGPRNEKGKETPKRAGH
jgi:YNFM family putative membrane transporter